MSFLLSILSTTLVYRGDDLDKIIYMLLGPLRHKFTSLERAQEQGIGHYFIPRYTRVVDNIESKNDIHP